MATRKRLSKHFTVEEFDCRDGTKVQKRDYDGLAYLCRTYLEPLRAKYGRVSVHSGYRTPSYNARVGGARGSYHIYSAHDGNDQAADISCAKGRPTDWLRTLAAIRQRERGGKGGLGLYRTFVHVDLRDYSSNWKG
jgi:uncharacterized protein YcbK (DUF882 family)